MLSNIFSLFALTETRISPKMLHSWQISYVVTGLSQLDFLQHLNHSISFSLKTHSTEYHKNLLLGNSPSNYLKNLALGSPLLFARVSPIIITGEFNNHLISSCNTMASNPLISFLWILLSV